MKKTLLFLSILICVFIFKINAQIINPGFETWTTDLIAPPAMNPNSGNNTFGWWDYNYFNSPIAGSSPVSVTRCTDTVRTGNYSVRLETKVYTQTSWNIYKNWGFPFIGHQYNDTLGILFNGKVNVSNQSFIPGTACTQRLSQYKFYYQYRPNGIDTAECRVELLSNGIPVAGGVFKTNTTTGSSGWQQAVIDFVYVNGLVPDTLWVLYGSSSLDKSPKAGSVLWIDDVSVTLSSGIEKMLSEENEPQIFPNPSNGNFTVRKTNNQPANIEIFNLLGEKIYSATNNNNTSFDIDISHYPKGIYFLKISDAEKCFTKEIVVR